MKRGILLYTSFEAERNRFFVSKLIDAARKYGLSLDLTIADASECLNTENVTFAVNRTNNALLAENLEKSGLRVFNSSHVSHITNSKYRSCRFASALGIPTMPTEIFDSGDVPAFDLPIVVKPDNGKGGKNVSMVHTDEELRDAVRSINAPYVVQKAASDLGRDTRVYMLGKMPVAAMTRVSDSDFRSNFCLGGKAYVHNLSAEEREYAIAVASALNSDYVGVDLIYDGGKPIFGEIEDAVGARMLYTHTDIDIADMYMNYISLHL